MDNEGYPEQWELDKIKNWDYKDFLGLIDFIGCRWAYANSGYFKKYWGKSSLNKNPILNLELHTAGWSGNEGIINSLLENNMFRMIWYKKWERGGHFYFEINPYNVGYEPVSAIAIKKNISRQYIHKTKNNYDWIYVDGGKNLIREKSPIADSK